MWFWIIVASVAGLYFLKPKRSDPNALRKPDYKKDVTYIVQFPVSPSIRTISPFALKLETYLRLKKVQYEPVYGLKFSKKGQIGALKQSCDIKCRHVNRSYLMLMS